MTMLSVVIPERDEVGCIAATGRHLSLELRLHEVPHEILARRPALWRRGFTNDGRPLGQELST